MCTSFLAFLDGKISTQAAEMLAFQFTTGSMLLGRANFQRQQNWT